MQNKIFISGTSGFQGGAIAKQAIQKGYKVISLSSSDQSKNEEIEFVSGGFEDVNAIKKALKNVDKAIFTLPLIFDVKKVLYVLHLIHQVKYHQYDSQYTYILAWCPKLYAVLCQFH